MLAAMAEYKINLPPAFGTTSMGGEESAKATPWWAWLVAAIGIAGVTIGITCLFLGMKDVMEVGGSCADGGPYVSRQPCPHGTAALTLLGIFGGLLALIPAGYGLNRISGRAVMLVILAWGGLFGSLGYNFLYYAKNPPPNMSGTAGWWVCGILFIAMALPGIIAPLFALKGVESAKRLPVVALLVVSIVGGILAGNAIADKIRKGRTKAPVTQILVPVNPSTNPTQAGQPVQPVPPAQPSSTAAAEAQLRAAAAQLRAAQAQLRAAQRQNQK